MPEFAAIIWTNLILIHFKIYMDQHFFINEAKKSIMFEAGCPFIKSTCFISKEVAFACKINYWFGNLQKK